MKLLVRNIIFLIALLYSIPATFAQQTSIRLSNDANFSSDVRTFSRNETLYVRVVAPHINGSDLDKNRLELSPGSGNEEVEKQFQVLPNGVFTGQIDLSTLSNPATNWELEARLEDHNEREFRQSIQITINPPSDDGGDDDSGDGSDDNNDNGDDGDNDGSGDGGNDGDGNGDNDGSGDGGNDGDGNGDNDGGDDGNNDGDGSGDNDGGDDGSSDGDNNDNGSDDNNNDGNEGDGTENGDDNEGNDGSAQQAQAIIIAGSISQVNSNSITVSDTTFAIHGETEVINDDASQVPATWLRVGVSVTIAGLHWDDGSFQADQIMLQFDAPAYFQLLQNYPNPFSNKTTIEFAIFDQPQAATKLSIFDVLGREIAVLVDEELPVGQHRVAWQPSTALANGTYFCRITIGGFSQTRPLVFRQ